MSVFTPHCLEGTYLVTGASSGIGLATAVQIAEAGGRVLGTGRDDSRLAALLAKLPGSGHRTAAIDLQDADQVADWIKGTAATDGELAGIFHAAGIEFIRPARLVKQSNLNEVFRSSLYASFGIARAAGAKGVVRDGGSLVFMSSVAGQTGQAGMTAYSAAKAGIDGMVRSLACEMAARRIRVNAIAAGAVKTSMHERLLRTGGENMNVEYERSHLLGFGEAGDIASAVVFLLGPASRWITGTVMAVDGGYMVR
jgi:NAD(P)-dependent dehydrogenase (short-subunit alcohol dehydrogenase family)